MIVSRAGAVVFALAIAGCASGVGDERGGSSPVTSSAGATSTGSTGVVGSSDSGETAAPTTTTGESGDESTAAPTGTGVDATTSSSSGTGSEPGGSSGESSSSGVMPGCGDAVVDAPELCDDGNAVDGDGCNADCQPSGQLLWSTTHAGGLGLVDEAMGCDVDGTGSIYVSGFVGLSKTDADLWLRKYSAAGEVLWTHTHAGSALVKDEARGVVVDPAELVYAAGYINTSMQDNDVFVRKFAADGTPVWTKGYNGAALLGDYANAATLTPQGDLLVGGVSSVLDQGNDAWLRKYGPGGNVLWTRTHSGGAKSNDAANAIAVTEDGYIYVAGQEAVAGESSNMWLGKYDADGNLLWSRLYNGAVGKADYLNGAVAMDDGGVVVCGYETADSVPWRSFVRRYDAGGLVVWTEIEDGPTLAGAVCYGLDLAANGDLLLAGAAMEGMTREPRIRRLGADGTPRWSALIVGAGAGGSQARCVRQALDGTVVVTGAQDEGTDSRDIWVARFSQ